MTIISFDIKDCSQCPFHETSPYPTADSFERPEYWWCKNPDVEEVNAPNDGAEERRLQLKLTGKFTGNVKSIRYVAGYVEWNDKIPLPEWCPCKLEG